VWLHAEITMYAWAQNAPPLELPAGKMLGLFFGFISFKFCSVFYASN